MLGQLLCRSLQVIHVLQPGQRIHFAECVHQHQVHINSGRSFCGHCDDVQIACCLYCGYVIGVHVLMVTNWTYLIYKPINYNFCQSLSVFGRPKKYEKLRLEDKPTKTKLRRKPSSIPAALLVNLLTNSDTRRVFELAPKPA